MKRQSFWLRKRKTKVTISNELLQRAIDNMSFSSYQLLAARTIREGMPQGKTFLHSLFGAVTEIGQLIDLYKDQIQNDTPVDEQHAKKQLGDILWFLAEFCTVNGWDMGEIPAMNIKKLMARFPEGFKVQNDLNRSENDV